MRRLADTCREIAWAEVGALVKRHTTNDAGIHGAHLNERRPQARLNLDE